MNIKFSNKMFSVLLAGTISLSTSTGYAFKNSSPSNKGLPNYEEYVVATTNVNIRRGPSVDSEKLGLLYNGSSLKFLGYDGEWAIVMYNDEIAYVNSKYINIDSKVVINGEKQGYGFFNRDSVIYSGDNDRKMPRYELCEIYDSDSSYYLVKSDNTAGYVTKRNITKLDGKFVVIDISSQTASLYNGTKVMLNASIVSGSLNNPSDIGIFKVYSKRQNVYLTGESYSRFVNYWIAYNGGEGMHDAIWRSNFGGTIYKKNGSHGCINMKLKDAEYVYENVKIVTKVLVKK